MWSSVTIGGRSADVFTPADRPRFLLVFLPDLDEVTLRDNPVWTPLLAANRVACVCPAGSESWWVDRPCPSFDLVKSGEEYLLQDVIPTSLAQFALAPRAVAVAGVGAGAQAAIRFGLRYPDRFRVAAGLGSILDYHELFGRGTRLDEMYDSREQCRQDTAVLQVHPSSWPPHLWLACDPDSPWLRGNDRLHEKLQALGVPHATEFLTRGCGHSWSYYDRMAPKLVRFVVDGLEAEARRLV
jgi:S-formylglutathione hydrolase